MKKKFDRIMKIIISLLILIESNFYCGIFNETKAVNDNSENSYVLNTIMDSQGDISVESSKILDSEGNSVEINIIGHSDNDEINILAIKLPDGTIADGNTAVYDAPCNGIYQFDFLFEVDNINKVESHFVYVFESNLMSDGNKPSPQNGFYSNNQQLGNTLSNNQESSGTIYYKLYGNNVTVDGQIMGSGGGGHYVAQMMDSEGWFVYCLDPELTAATNFSAYTDKPITTSDETVEGKNGLLVPQKELALTWYYTNVDYDKNMGLSADDWIFTCQLLLWDMLGYSVTNYDSKYQRAMSYVEDKISKHTGLIAQSYDDKLEIWENAPWGDGRETVDGTGGTCEVNDGVKKCIGGYLDLNGNVNTVGGQYVPFDWRTQYVNFGEARYLYGDDAKFNIVQSKDADDVVVWVVESTEGGTVSLRHSDDELKDFYKGLYDLSSDAITVSYAETADAWIYNFERIASLSESDSFIVALTDSVNIGSSFMYSAIIGEGTYQPLMQFCLPMDLVKKIEFKFSEVPGSIPSETAPAEPKDLSAPIIIKQDGEGNYVDGTHFPIEGATFEFYAGEKFEIHFQERHAEEVEPAYCEMIDGEEVCYEAVYEWGEWEDSKSETVWKKGEEVMASEVTPSDGKIDTSPIIDNYYELAAEIIADKLAENTPLEEDGIEYQHHEDYVDEEAEGWIGGEFYAIEPETSQNTCNSDPAGSYTCKAEFDGYLNLSKYEKIRFTISEDNSGEQQEIIHDNERQKGRFTIHKVDNESSYLNHNNTHEAQGDGYFYGSVFVVTAREDIVLHDGTIAYSPFTGKPLVVGEVADILVMTQTPDDALNNINTATTRMLELGEYAVQEIRLPGVYKAELPLIQDKEDKLWHVDPAQAETVLSGLKDKTSAYYQFDYDKAADLYNDGVIPTNSPDGGYWYKNYINGLVNTANSDFVGGQTVAVDIKYVGEDYAYNEVVPNDCDINKTSKFVEIVNVNGETTGHMMPPINYSVSRGNSYKLTKNAGLDYANSIQKGHIQFKKILTEGVDIDGTNDNTGITDDLNIAGKDIYFAVYLDSKVTSLVKDSTNPSELADCWFAEERLDGLKYVYDADGNFERYVDETPQNGSVTKYRLATEEEIKANKGLVMVSVDGTTNGMIPADNYYKWELEEISENAAAVVRRNSYRNSYQNNVNITNANLSDKTLYMILKTNNEGLAGTNMPDTIVWTNYAALGNTGNKESYGVWDYARAIQYSKEHAEVLDYLQASGLPLPYGTYTVVEMNSPEGYESVAWNAQVSKNLTTYDINGDSTVYELGIINSTEGTVLEDYSDTTDPQGWSSKQESVNGNGTQGDETWLNKQFHVFSDYVSTSRYAGRNVEDRLHKQILQIVKVDAETGEAITTDGASFRIFQWNSMLDLNEEWMHAEYRNGQWHVTYVIPEYDVEGNIIDTTVYNGTDWYEDSKGLERQLGQWIIIPASSTGIYMTDADGQITLSNPIPVGHYFLLETEAPEGYLLNMVPVVFDIEAVQGPTEPNQNDTVAVPKTDEDGKFVCKTGKECNDPDSEDYALDEFGNVVPENCEWESVPNLITITITVQNEPQKGYVEVEKRGSIFKSFVQYVTDFLDLVAYKPTWTDEDEVVRLNTTFCVYAEEDIVVNSEVKYETDELIQKMDTNDEGHAYSEPLYLGKYYVQECVSPHGYLTNEEKIPFELKYDEQTVIVHPEFKDLVNRRQKLRIELNKSDEEGQPLEGVIFGIFAGEDLPRAYKESDNEFIPHEYLPAEYMILMIDDTDMTATIMGAYAFPESRYIIPSTVEQNGKTYTIKAIGSYAFYGYGLEGVVIPSTVTHIGVGAFDGNTALDFVQFLGTTPPEFGDDTVFPKGTWKQKCVETSSGQVCDLIYDSDENSLLGIYIPWSRLSEYDLAIVGEMADNSGEKDNRLMDIPLKDANNIWDEDEEFSHVFDKDGFSYLGAVEDSIWNLEEAEDVFSLRKGSKTVTLENGTSTEIEGYFITGYRKADKTVIVPEAIIDEYGFEVRVVGIDARAFYHTNTGYDMASGNIIESIMIPDSIQYIGEEAFTGNESLTTLRFYETQFMQQYDATGNGSTPVEDSIMLSESEENCWLSGGTWKDKGDGTYACAYAVTSHKDISQEECAAADGSYDELIGYCMVTEEKFGEMPNTPEPETPGMDDNMGVETDSKTSCEMAGGKYDEINNDCIFSYQPSIMPLMQMELSEPEEKTNSQLACEVNGGTWDTANMTCIGGEVETELYDGMEYKTNSHKACEALGGEWNAALGTCSTGIKKVFKNEPFYIAGNAFDFTPNLTWIIANECGWMRFDTVYILDEDEVYFQDEERDGFLWWNPETLNPYTGEVGYWEMGEYKPAMMGYPIVINVLSEEDIIDPGMNYENEMLPGETTSIPEDTLMEIVKTDSDGYAVTQFDYMEGLYYVKELKAPKGYQTSNDKYYAELLYDESEEPVLTYQVNNGDPIINEKNHNYPLRIEIIKIDGDTSERLEGAEFQLWNADRSFMLEDGLITDSNGSAVTKGLYNTNDGTEKPYWIKEVKTPEGYELDGDAWIQVDVDHYIEDEDRTTKIYVENFKPDTSSPSVPSEKDYLRVRLYKKMEESEHTDAWKDVVFGIFAAEDIYSGTEESYLVYEKDDLLVSGTINEHGVFDEILYEKDYLLTEGQYYVMETHTNEHYELDDTKYYFEYQHDNNPVTTILINNGKPIVNKLILENEKKVIHPNTGVGNNRNLYLIMLIVSLVALTVTTKSKNIK